MTNKVEKTRDLRDKLGDSQKERWYNNIILHVPHGTDNIFVPDEKDEKIKVVITNKPHDGEEVKELIDSLYEHSLLIDCYTCDSSLTEEDICITTNRDSSRPTKFVLRLILYSLKQYGYTVSLNRPFRYAMSPDTDFSYNAIGLVINDRLYEDKEKTSRLRCNLTSLYKLLYNYWEKTKD